MDNIINMFVEIGLLVIALIITLAAYIFHERNSEVDYRNKCYTRSCKNGNSDCGVTVFGAKHKIDPVASNVMNIRTITDSQPDTYIETVCAKGYDGTECTTWA